MQNSSDDLTLSLPKTAQERGKVAPVKLAHLALRTEQLTVMTAWYCTVLEAEIAQGMPQAAFLTYDEEHHRIALLQSPGLETAPGNAKGVDHVSFTYAGLDQLIATYERLLLEDIRPFWCINHGPTLSMYYADPDGNHVELQIDIFATPAETNDWLINSDFGTNPIGVKFDPAELISRYRSGEPADKLLERPRIQPQDVPAQLP